MVVRIIIDGGECENKIFTNSKISLIFRLLFLQVRSTISSCDVNCRDGSLTSQTLTKTKEMLDDMHKRKIDMADAIYVINVGGYIGESTRSEINYAIERGKKVRYLED